MPRFPILVLAIVFAALLFAACGGGGGGDRGSSGDDGATASATTPGAPPLSDTAYLKTLCTGLTSYQDALLSAKDANAIATVIRDFSASMKAVNPPEDLRPFNAAFVGYLDAAVADPTSLVTTAPPLPEESVRQRLAGKVRDVPECKYPTFLREPR